MPNNSNKIIGVILSGGLSRRMNNQDKGFIQLAHKPLFEHVLERLSPQCDSIIISSNKESQQLSSYDLPIIKDSLEGLLGPLAGLLACMQWVRKHQPGVQWIASVPVDTPFIPQNLVSTLYQSMLENTADIACATSNGRTHPVIALWPIRLLDDLEAALSKENIRKIDLWTSRYKVSLPDFSDSLLDPFYNINCHEDLVHAEALLRKPNENTA